MGDQQLRSTVASYDLIVEDYERQSSDPAGEVLAFRNSFVDALPRRAAVADLGCGPGRDLEHFRSRQLVAVGIDASIGMVRRVRERGLAVVVGDLRRPPLRPGAWHGLWSSASLLHVPGAGVPATLAAWNRLLIPGGTLGLTTSLGTEEGWEVVPYAPGTQERTASLHRWFAHHDRPMLEQALTAAGFTITDAHVRESHRVWLQLLATKTASRASSDHGQ